MSNLKKIEIKKYKVIKKTKGKILKFFSSKDKNYFGFGEIYTSLISSKEIRAWKYHENLYMNLFVIKGKIKFVFYCPRLKKIKVSIMTDKMRQKLTVPPKIWYGFKNLSLTKSSIMNVTNIIHNKKKIKNKSKNFINFNWKKD